jgi:protein ImuB
MVVCVHLPRFELLVAAGEGSQVGLQTLRGRPLAVAPAVGAERGSGAGAAGVGEVSQAAEANGVRRGMALGEALARCPELVLLPADPVRVAERWEGALQALEAIGAAVEPARPGLAYFEADGLRALHGTLAATLASAQGALAQQPVRLGAAPTRFCALACALAARSRRPLVREGEHARRWLATQPVELLGYREQTAVLPEPLARLGVRTLGELTRLGRAALSDRFGAAGILAHRLSCGQDHPLAPRRVQERLEESLEVGDASSGLALGRVLGVLVRRLLARPQRAGRSLRTVVLSAQLLAGGGWRERVVLRQPLADAERIRLALSVRLLTLPGPACRLGLSVECFGAPIAEQGVLEDPGAHAAGAQRAVRAALLREALAQVRSLAGAQAALRVVCVDPASRVPERRVVLTPIPE